MRSNCPVASGKTMTPFNWLVGWQPCRYQALTELGYVKTISKSLSVAAMTGATGVSKYLEDAHKAILLIRDLKPSAKVPTEQSQLTKRHVSLSTPLLEIILPIA